MNKRSSVSGQGACLDLHSAWRGVWWSSPWLPSSKRSLCRAREKKDEVLLGREDREQSSLGGPDGEGDLCVRESVCLHDTHEEEPDIAGLHDVSHEDRVSSKRNTSTKCDRSILERTSPLLDSLQNRVVLHCLVKLDDHLSSQRNNQLLQPRRSRFVDKLIKTV